MNMNIQTTIFYISWISAYYNLVWVFANSASISSRRK